MKKALITLLIALLALSFFSACSSDSSSGKPEVLDISKFIQKNVSLYFKSGNQIGAISGIPLYFTSQDSLVPYIKLSDACLFYQRLSGGRLFLELGTKGEHVLVSNAKTKATLEADGQNQKLIFSDFDKFFETTSMVTCTDVISRGKDTHLLHEKATEKTAGEKIISLCDYGISLYAGLVNGNPEVLLPFRTFCDLSSSFTLSRILYNGYDLFLASYDDLVDSSKETNELTDFGKHYFRVGESEKVSERNAELLDFNYKELLLNLEINYGLKERQGITTFDSALTAWGTKEALLSPSAEAAGQAISDMIYQEIGDLHSSYGCMSPFTAGGFKEQEANFSASGLQYLENRRELRSQRAIAFQDEAYTPKGTKRKYPGFQIVEDTYTDYKGETQSGVTAFIRFDQFIDSGKDYADATIRENLFSNEKIQSDFDASGVDTIGLVVYANKKIRDWDETHQDLPVKNVVIDLSCNGGGSMDAGAFLTAWLLGKAPISLVSTTTGARATAYYYADANMDGTFQTKENNAYQNSYYKDHGTDEERQKYAAYYQDTVIDKNIYLLTSNASFSCGNLVPYIVKNSRRGMLIGSWTGGGACAVLSTATADGTAFNISSNRKACYESNGSFIDLDNGTAADWPLANASEYFDVKALTKMINTRILTKEIQ